MPSALEKLVKILKLEQETGFKNTAVIGGLQSYVHNWTIEAHQQAKTTEHHALVEELAKVIDYYGTLEDKDGRYNTIRYMLGRITGRTESLPQFKVVWTDEDQASLAAKLPPPTTPPPIPPPPQRPQRAERPERPEERRDAPTPKEEHHREERRPERRREEPPRREPRRDSRSTSREPDALQEAMEVVTTIPTTRQVVVRPQRPQTPQAKPRNAKREALTEAQIQARWRRLNDSIKTLKGVGERRQTTFEVLGIRTIGDLIFNFPRRYDDYTQVLPLGKILPFAQITAVGTIKNVTEQQSRERRSYLRVLLEDTTGTLPVIFFNQPFLKRYFRVGMQIAVFGKVELYLGKPQITNPEWEEVDPKGVFQGSIVPIYPLTKGLTNKVLRGFVETALKEYGNLPDYMPLSVLERTEMVDLAWAMQQLHFPEHPDYLHYAQERLAFDELILLQLGILGKRYEWQSEAGVPLHVEDEWLEDYAASLPYNLTNAQIRAVTAIREDIRRPVPMTRLLQGDVGAGKTVVAAMALGIAVKNGYQAAIMAPTSILAEQHYQGLPDFLGRMPDMPPVNIRLLTGATSESERRDIYAGLADGSIQVIVGTQALIQERVEFRHLALAVIDEQHRFGVDERANLRGKGNNPHILVMTATPIPRTLALTLYADLDLTILDELPPGRTPIRTKVVYAGEREKAYEFIRSELDMGRQAYIIYPLVEASDSIQAKSAVESFETLSKSDFFGYRIGLLHGRIKPVEKDAIMSAFARHEIDVLVSTSVIEVGINVPNASVMMIEGANRFGLAQLHQLRGRVGRGEHPSYCFVLADTHNDESEERLRALEQTTDGFKLAELDWQMRGAGDLLGTRQAGMGTLSQAAQMNMALVELAQIEAKSIYAEDPTLSYPEHQLLAQRIESLSQKRTDFS